MNGKASSFGGKVVVVTGAGGGVGQEVVKQLVQLDASILATDITDSVHELRERYPNAN
jgi:NAD(P)-dependent dehydrogenase (short-subunit alcohol dehydrogenase family)